MGITQSIWNFFWWLRWFGGASCRQIKDKKNFPLKINYYLLKCIGVTIIYPIYLTEKLTLYYLDTKVFVVQTACSFVSVIAAHDRQTNIVRVYIRTPAWQTQRETPPDWSDSHRRLTPTENCLNWHNFKN